MKLHRTCRRCLRVKRASSWPFCSSRCEELHRRNARQQPHEMSAAQVEDVLARAVAMETAAPWVRHRQPWTNVRASSPVRPTLALANQGVLRAPGGVVRRGDDEDGGGGGG